MPVFIAAEMSAGFMREQVQSAQTATTSDYYAPRSAVLDLPVAFRLL